MLGVHFVLKEGLIYVVCQIRAKNVLWGREVNSPFTMERLATLLEIAVFFFVLFCKKNTKIRSTYRCTSIILISRAARS